MPDEVPPLDALNDLVTPQGFFLWPLAPGMQVILVALLCTFLFFLWKKWKQVRANVYRKEALMALEQSQSPVDVAAVLKRCAKLHLSSEELAAFSANEWILFLGRSGPVMPEALQKSWQDWIYSGADQADVLKMKQYATRWVQDHRFPEENS